MSNSIGQKILKRLENFVNKLKSDDPIDILSKLHPQSQYVVEYQTPNYEISNMSSRQAYLENCRKENRAIREQYGPILITYIREPQKLVMPSKKFTDEELLTFYHMNFQNSPIGCVVAVRIDGEIHYGWSLCHKKDRKKHRFTKVVCLNRALNRAISGDGNFASLASVIEIPSLVLDYLCNLEHRAQKYFNKYDQ